MNISYFTKYSRKGASSRLRSFQYAKYLEGLGCKSNYYPLFSDLYLIARYDKKTPVFIALKGYLTRIIKLIRLNKRDVLIIEKELFPFLPFFIERFFLRRIEHIILDFDDAIFHNYDQHTNKFIRIIFKNKIDKLMSISDLVVVCNSYLEQRAIQAGAKNVIIIPTVVDLKQYKQLKKYNQANKFVIGWIGSPSTFKYLKNIEGVLKRAVNELNVVIYIIGVNDGLGIVKNIHYFEWNESTESDIINQFDIGLMPLENTSWSRGKCAYKLIQYMACSKAVIASPVGMNSKIVQHGENGFLAESEEDWLKFIKIYQMKPELLLQHGSNGFQLIQKEYNLSVTSERLYKALCHLKNLNDVS